jgi:3-methyladenine DNA glycosylase Tag
MEIPQKIEPRTPSDYFEVLTRAVFQAGMSWQVVKAKWEGFRRAFCDFDPERVARFTPSEIDALTRDPAIIRNTRKIVATVDNADTLVSLDREHDGFKNYLRSHGGFDQTVADLKRQFRFLGDFGAYYFLYVVGEEVPPHREWAAARGRRVPQTP